MSNTLLVEIVTEEIPAGYIPPALDAMSQIARDKLSHARIAHGAARTYGTPRRLALVIEDVAESQTPVTEEILGPPKNVAFDGQGNPTKAAVGFAKNQGVSVRRLAIKPTAKGDYVYVKKTAGGRSSRKVLSQVLPDVIRSIPFPKSMRWADFDLTFARPIHAVVALLGDRIIPFALQPVKSGRRSLGHRFMHPKTIGLGRASEYLEALRSAYVIADVAERKALIEGEVSATAENLGGRILQDEALLETVTHLVEYVAVSGGRFDASFLEVPKEVLITAMREHQKYFAVVDAADRLLPCFVAVNNTPAENPQVVTTGHERVLRARLEDARFFFEADIKLPLTQMLEKLKGVTFQAQLGSMFDKVCRVEGLAAHLSEMIAPALRSELCAAARFCKADLTSQMVGEFPKLQGTMGRIYAQHGGQAEGVCRAIEEHYMPVRAGSALPTSLSGALLSIADKMDTVCACFGIGLIPTGTTDPYALRRQAVGIIQIILDKDLSISLTRLIESALLLLEDKLSQDMDETRQAISDFFRHRVEQILVDGGFAKDLVAAVITPSIDHLPAVVERAQALTSLKAKPDFDPLATAFKRVVNIIKKARQDGEIPPSGRTVEVDSGLFQEECETVLYRSLNQVRDQVLRDIEARTYDKALTTVATLKAPVDAFFDGVMVLTDDQQIKQNRLALLSEISDLFALFADFSRIST